MPQSSSPSPDRNLWEVFVSLLQKVRVRIAAKVAEKRQRKQLEQKLQQEQWRHLLRVPASQNYQVLIDQIMDHQPYGQPLLQQGRFVDPRKQGSQETEAHPAEDVADSVPEVDHQRRSVLLTTVLNARSTAQHHNRVGD